MPVSGAAMPVALLRMALVGLALCGMRGERGLSPDQLYISSYWKQGLVEDQHREVKYADSVAASA
ncbi:hypothetical protein [Pelagibacterium lacus]|uniref:hypothetical protein n=1 Tax=Pelagibacterium lacus TaxID=2282655 RepID=UPI0018F30039|nr:hypothetical protein [Pelagibacterium lacus]